MSLSKLELKKKLRSMGIRVEGNYVRKSEIEKVVTAAKAIKVKILEWKGTEYDSEYRKGDSGYLTLYKNSFTYEPIDGEARHSHGGGVMNISSVDITNDKTRVTAKKSKHSFKFNILSK